MRLRCEARASERRAYRVKRALKSCRRWWWPVMGSEMGLEGEVEVVILAVLMLEGEAERRAEGCAEERRGSRLLGKETLADLIGL
jgi:hypothetical protein